MTELAKPPLLEVIFELRWGKVIKNNNQSFTLNYSQEEIDFFPGQFKTAISKIGFHHIERLNQELGQQLPHIPNFRFRKGNNEWPCYQIGRGLFTSNQINEGYKWESFFQNTLIGLKTLDESYPGNFAGMSIIGAELRFEDVFIFDKDETSQKFLEEKFFLSLTPPQEFFNYADISNEIGGISLSFKVASEKPKGFVIVELLEAIINGKPGFLMKTAIRSSDEHVPELSMEALKSWINGAHNIQRHVFGKIIKPSFMETFK